MEIESDWLNQEDHALRLKSEIHEPEQEILQRRYEKKTAFSFSFTSFI